MKTHYDLADLPIFRRPVLTIGSFDGVHRGHQQLLSRIQRIAERRGGESIVVTFDPHPRSVLRPEDDSLRLLTTTEEKRQHCAAAGIDHLVVVPFSLEFSEQAPEAYIENFLFKLFRPDRIVIGYDHRFGKDRQGDISYLRHLGRRYDYEVIEIAAQEVDDITVSSTKIRRALLHGEIALANQLLGRRYALSGTVVEGQKIGRKIGFPTANLSVANPLKLIPVNGIYAVRASWEGQTRDGMLYIGDRPSLNDGRGITIELNLFDFNDDLYGKDIEVEFVDFLREDLALVGLEELRLQLGKDETAARASLADARPTFAVKEKVYGIPTAVVILNYNGRDYLETYLQTVIDTLPEFARVIVADNASTDDSVSWLAEFHPEVERIVLDKNHGFAGGYNHALAGVDSELYVLLNSDVRVTPGWIETISGLFSDPTIGAVQPKVLAEADPDRFEYAGAAGGYLDFLGYPFCRGRIFAHTERDEGQYDGRAEVFWATGAALFIRSKVFHELGGFEYEYFAHQEEIDLCWRMKRAGYRVMVEPRSVVYHVGGGTLSYNTPRKTYLNFRNTLVTSYKNERTSRLFWWLPTRLVMDGLAGVLFLTQGNFAHIKAILDAHFHFYRHLPMWLRRRRERRALIEEHRIGPDRSDVGKVADSVVLHYYLLGHRRYAEVQVEQVLPYTS